MAGRRLGVVARAVPAFAAGGREGGVALSSDCIAALLRHARPLPLPQGTALYRQGEAGNGCYWVVRGLLKGTIVAEDAEAVVVSIFGPGDLVGSIAAIDGLPRPISVEAISDCELIAIDRASFQLVLEIFPEFYRWLTAILVDRMREAYDDKAAKFRRVPGRVAHALLKVAMLAGEPLDDCRIGLAFTLSHDVLASIAGVSRESATRALGDWRKQGIIERSARYPMVIRKQGLAQDGPS